MINCSLNLLYFFNLNLSMFFACVSEYDLSFVTNKLSFFLNFFFYKLNLLLTKFLEKNTLLHVQKDKLDIFPLCYKKEEENSFPLRI